MRITGGQAKGITVKAPKGTNTRPTSDKLREAIFDTLGARVVEAHVLDLFAGSGALGIEALSRGAAHAVFVERNPAAARLISENLAKASLSEKGEIIRADFRSAVKKLAKAERKFQLVFVDPPYQAGLTAEVADALTTFPVTSPESLVILEHFKKLAPPPVVSGLPLVQTRHYGQTALSYFGSMKGKKAFE